MTILRALLLTDLVVLSGVAVLAYLTRRNAR